MKKRVIKSIIIVLAVVIVILGINFFRNYMILTELDNNRMKYVDNENYHIIETIIKKNDNEIREAYKKGDKEVEVYEIKSQKFGQTKISIYKTGEIGNRYDLINKTANLGFKTYQSSEKLFNEFGKISFTECLLSIINKDIIEDKECYRIQRVFEKDFVVFFEKESGLPIESIIEDTTVKIEYEFGNVEDSVFIEPDITEYIVEKNVNN